MPTPSSHNGDGPGKASHTWRTQNAKKKKPKKKSPAYTVLQMISADSLYYFKDVTREALQERRV